MKKPRNSKVKTEASIVNGILYFEDASQCPVDDPRFQDIVGDGYTNALRLVSLDTNWYVSVYTGGAAFRHEDVNVEMTLRREVRYGRGYWYAYRRVMNKLHKRYVGTDEQITQKRLLEIAQKMPTL